MFDTITQENKRFVQIMDCPVRRLQGKSIVGRQVESSTGGLTILWIAGRRASSQDVGIIFRERQSIQCRQK